MIIKRLQLRDFKLLKYNYYKSNKDENDKYFYDKCCRVSYIIYELECKLYDKKYIRNIQIYLKTRTNQHFNDIVKLVNKGIRLDLFVLYFKNHFNNYKRKTNTITIIKIIKAANI